LLAGIGINNAPITATCRAFILQKIKNYRSRSGNMEKWKQETEALKIVEAEAGSGSTKVAEARPVIWKRKQ